MKLPITPADETSGKLKSFFNWLAEPPKRNFTLGEAWQHFVLKKPYAEINDNRLGFSNAGRISERLHMAGGLLTAALVVAAAPSLTAAFAAAVAVTGIYKVWGIAGGKLADLAVRGSLLPRNKEAQATL